MSKEETDQIINLPAPDLISAVVQVRRDRGKALSNAIKTRIIQKSTTNLAEDIENALQTAFHSEFPLDAALLETVEPESPASSQTTDSPITKVLAARQKPLKIRKSKEPPKQEIAASTSLSPGDKALLSCFEADLSVSVPITLPTEAVASLSIQDPTTSEIQNSSISESERGIFAGDLTKLTCADQDLMSCFDIDFSSLTLSADLSKPGIPEALQSKAAAKLSVPVNRKNLPVRNESFVVQNGEAVYTKMYTAAPTLAETNDGQPDECGGGESSPASQQQQEGGADSLLLLDGGADDSAHVGSQGAVRAVLSTLRSFWKFPQIKVMGSFCLLEGFDRYKQRNFVADDNGRFLPESMRALAESIVDNLDPEVLDPFVAVFEIDMTKERMLQFANALIKRCNYKAAAKFIMSRDLRPLVTDQSLITDKLLAPLLQLAKFDTAFAFASKDVSLQHWCIEHLISKHNHKMAAKWIKNFGHDNDPKYSHVFHRMDISAVRALTHKGKFDLVEVLVETNPSLAPHFVDILMDIGRLNLALKYAEQHKLLDDLSPWYKVPFNQLFKEREGDSYHSRGDDQEIQKSSEKSLVGPFLRLESANITFVSTESELEDFLTCVTGSTAIGLDCEWRPTVSRTTVASGSTRVAVMQVSCNLGLTTERESVETTPTARGVGGEEVSESATPPSHFHELPTEIDQIKRVFLLDMIALSKSTKLDAVLLNVFQNHQILKFGFAFRHDLKNLASSYPHFQSFRFMASYVDLGALHSHFVPAHPHPHHKQHVSTQSQSSIVVVGEGESSSQQNVVLPSQEQTSAAADGAAEAPKTEKKLRKEKKAKAGSKKHGFKGSLAELCRIYLGMELDKRCQLSDWERRPLSAPQTEYAALDAAVLLVLGRQIVSKQPTTTDFSYLTLAQHLGQDAASHK